MPGRKPLARHLIQAALLATLLPLLTMVALGLWQYEQDYQRVEHFTGEESLSAARVVTNMLDFLVDDTRNMLTRVANAVETNRVNETLLAFEVDSQAQTEGLAVTDERGIVRSSTFGERGRDVSDLEVFQAVKSGKQVAHSDVFRSEWLRENAVIIAVPFKRDGQFGGMVFARLNLKVLQNLLTARLDDPRLRTTYVVDRQGTIISHYDPDLVAKATNLRPSEPVQAALAGKSGWMKYASFIDGSPRIGGYVSMPGTGWVVVSTRTPGESVLGIEERLRNQLLLSALAGLLVSMWAWWWGRRLARPLESLESTFRHELSSSAGPTPTLGQAQVYTGVAEYETLASGYNRMTAELNRRFEEILTLKNQLQAQNLELNIRNDELAMLTAQAQASNKLKDQFLANMSHELRTPLNSIIGFTELTLTDEHLEMDEENRTNHEIVLKSARHLLALINDILDLSKVEAGKMSLFVTPFEPAELVRAVVGTAMPMAVANRIALRAETPDGLGPVESDETKVRQILLNLVSNAVKFTKEGEVRVTMRAHGQDGWQVEVTDTGIGIAPEHQDLVFEEFRQVDASTTREIGGTGLGLSIARKLARLLGGDLTLESQLGVGSTFILTLPRHAPVAEAAPAVHTVPVRSVPASERQVLVVDDDPVARHLLVEKLRDTSYRPIPAGSREAGLKLAGERRPYAVLLDVKLRRQDDWDILAALKADPATAGLPVLIVSFEENRALAHSLGAVDFITKPVDRRQLLAALDRLALPVGAS
ncbi:Signal transduction histidine-protein kinase BarA [compost metagenome]